MNYIKKNHGKKMHDVLEISKIIGIEKAEKGYIFFTLNDMPNHNFEQDLANSIEAKTPFEKEIESLGIIHLRVDLCIYVEFNFIMTKEL